MPKFLKREVLAKPKFGITVKGKALGEDMLKYVEQVLVEDEDGMLPLATLTVQDVSRKWLNDIGIVERTPVTIAVGHQGNFKRVFNGRITYVEANFPETGTPILTIGCTDIASGILKERKARSWKKRKISDIIKLMHKEHNVKCVVDDTKVVLEHVIQEEGSNFSFILEWQKRLGAKYYKINDDTYYFGTKARNVKATETLSYRTGGHEILSFSPVYQEIEQVDIEEKELDENGEEIFSAVRAQPTYTALANSPVGKATPKSK